MIKGNEDHFSVGMMCRMLSVSRRGYYRWKNRPFSGRDQANQKLVDEIKRVFDDEKGRPDSSRITKWLQEESNSTSRHRIAKLMADNGLRAKAAKATSNGNHSLLAAPNLWSKILLRICLTQSGCRTSPIFGLKKVGCICRWCLSFIPAGRWGGLSESA